MFSELSFQNFLSLIYSSYCRFYGGLKTCRYLTKSYKVSLSNCFTTMVTFLPIVMEINVIMKRSIKYSVGYIIIYVIMWLIDELNVVYLGNFNLAIFQSLCT